MEIVKAIEYIAKYIPTEYINLTNQISEMVPYIFLVCALITCFFGLKFHRFWVGLIMAGIAFLIGCFSCLFFPSLDIRIFIGFGIILSILAIIFTKKLYKMQVFVMNFISTYIFVPNILSTFLPMSVSIILGLIIAVIVGILALKYKYIITIITTSITGSILSCRQLIYLLNINDEKNIILYFMTIILAIIGSIIQFILETKMKKTEKEEIKQAS